MDKSTIYLNFAEIVRRYIDHTALAYINKGKYKKISYKKFNSYILKLVDYFDKSGLKKGDRVCILSENRWEWPVVDFACNYLGIILVPIHTTYSSKYIEHIILKTSPRVIFVSNEKFFDNVLGMDKNLLQGIEKIITIDEFSKDGFDLENINDIFAKYSDNVNIEPINDENAISSIIFTSGTTGMPKGAMLSNKNIISNIRNVIKYVPIYSSDRFFSFLPLSHVLERTAGHITPLLLGASVYYSRNSKTIIEDIKIAEPTIFICVPRIFERVFNKINDNLRKASKIKYKFFYYALKMVSKINSAKRKGLKIDSMFHLRTKIVDKLVFLKIRSIFGGRLRIAISGGSSLDKRVARFFEDIGIKIIEGYGLTETSPIISVNKINDYKFGTVGVNLENLEVKINNDKEILVRGESVMSGYWQDEKSTKEAIDDENWFYTGDLGFIDRDGFLNIIGRKKEIIVLSTGKNIVPINIEQALNYDKYINQSMVIGNHQKFLTAIIVPDFEELKVYCTKNNIKIDSDNRYLNSQVIKDLYKERISLCLKDFADYEQIGDFFIANRQFDEEHDELTPTLKLKRERVKEGFGDVVKRFYN